MGRTTLNPWLRDSAGEATQAGRKVQRTALGKPIGEAASAQAAQAGGGDKRAVANAPGWQKNASPAWVRSGRHLECLLQHGGVVIIRNTPERWDGVVDWDIIQIDITCWIIEMIEPSCLHAEDTGTALRVPEPHPTSPLRLFPPRRRPTISLFNGQTSKTRCVFEV
jgi:hypothetical protein